MKPWPNGGNKPAQERSAAGHSLKLQSPLRAKLVGLIQAPATKLAQLANAPAAKLARVFAAYGDKDKAA